MSGDDEHVKLSISRPEKIRDGLLDRFDVCLDGVRIGHIEQHKDRHLGECGYNWQAIAGGERTAWHSMNGAIARVIEIEAIVIAGLITKKTSGILADKPRQR